MCLILFQGADSMEKSKRKINNKRDLAYCEPEKKNYSTEKPEHYRKDNYIQLDFQPFPILFC